MSKRLSLAAPLLLSALTLAGGARAADPVIVGDFTDWDIDPTHTGGSWIDPDLDGTVWFTEQYSSILAHLDPSTNVIKEWAVNAPGTAIDGVAADGLGNAYFTTPSLNGGGPNTIQRLDPSTNNFTKWTLPYGTTPGSFLLDWSGKVYFTMYNVGRIARIDPGTNTLTEWAVPSASSFPEDITVAGNGLVYFTEDNKHKIAELNPATGTFREWLMPAGGNQNDRIMLRIDEFTGDIWMTLSATNQIQRLRPSTNTFTRWAAPTVNCPAGGWDCYAYGIDVDAQGRAWFSDYVGLIWMLDPAKDAGTSSVSAPVSTVKAPLNTALVPTIINVAPAISVVAPRTSSSPPTVVGAFTGWQVGLVDSGPTSLRLGPNDDAWYGNYGDPPGIGRLHIHPDFAPTAVIGPVGQVLTGVAVNLDGTGSTDPENDPLTYQWTLVGPAGSAATLSNASASQPSFTPDVAGAYQVTLVVTDSHGVASTPVTIVLNAISPICLTIQRGTAGAVSDAQIAHKIASSPVLDVQGNTNYGALATGAIGRLPNNVATKLLVRFDLAAVPAGAQVLSSTLTVQTSTTSAGTVSLYRSKVAWNEATVTWLNFGTGQDSVLQASAFDGGAGYNGAMNFDIKPLTQSWVSGALANNGLVLSGEAFLTTTSTSETATIGNRPKLALCYIPPQ
ncbi:MAG: DNRLRE domain-containing protein [Byssovorax sp.]